MAKVTFIGLFDTIDEALSIRTSPQIDFYSVNGINILPLSQTKIKQQTNNHTGVSIEAYTAFLVNFRSGEEIDITNNFVVESLFQDSSGFNQVIWSVVNLPDIFNNGSLCYFRVEQILGQDYFSNPFTVSSYLFEKTAIIHYKEKQTDVAMSISLSMWFIEQLKDVELKNYYEISTKNTVTQSTKSRKYERWTTDVIGRDLAILISDLFEHKFVYIDGLRTNLFEAMEIAELTSKSQTKKYKIKLNVNKNDVFNETAEIAPVPVIPVISLNSIITNGFIVIYDFVISDFTPVLLTFEYSQDQINWISENKGITSPQNISFSEIGTWFFRIRHPLAISNVVELVVDSTIIANNDTVKVNKGSFVNIPVLFNDVLTGNVTITNVTNGANGTATVNPDRTIKYQHNNTFSGSDSFQYTISNGMTQSTATVSITILATVGTSTSFLTSAVGSSSPTTACGFNLSVTRYHTGASSVPTLDDFVFNDSSMTQPLVGSDQFFTIANGRTIQVNSNGRVTNLFACSGGFI